MKKHPVDDLFKNKLSGLERKPSPGAWKTIQEREKKTNRLGWVWYAAAGIALALGIGYTVWIDQKNALKPQIAFTIEPAAVPDTRREDRVLKKPDENVAVSEKHSETEKGKNVFSQKNIAPKKIETPKEELFHREVTSQNLVAAIPEKIEKPELITPNAELTMEPVKIPKLSEVAEKAGNRTIIVKVDVEEGDAEKQKSSRFTRIFRQLKNVKEGEAVNWNDVGFNPKAVVARVDDRLRQGEEKVSEKYQNIKERTKL